MNLLLRIWQGLLGLLSLLLPLGQAFRFRKIGPGGRLALHIILLALILVGLYFLNSLLAPLVIAPWARNIWLPLTFFLVYLLIWTAWWVWKLLMAEAEPSSFPDIDMAFADAERGLAQAGIRLADLPLFLVLGRPEAAEEHLFNAAQLNLVVKQTPPDPRAPIHVYASRDAIFLTCAGASLLGKHAANIALEGIEDMSGHAHMEGEDASDESKTIRPNVKEKKVIKQLRQVIGRQMNVVERRTARRELGLPMPDVLKNPNELRRHGERLAHFCRLLVAARHPFCPINGLLLLAPLGGTDTEHDAQATAEVCARDLATLRRVLKMQYPLFVLGCDLESLPGFQEFIGRVSQKDRLGRLGQRFPLSPPDLAGPALQSRIEESIHHLCNNYLRDWVYRLFRPEAAAGDSATNTGLYLLLDEMRNRHKNLSRILTQGLARDAKGPLLYGGCYLAGTGGDKERQQAFVAGVFKRLVENQNLVSWTDEAIDDDRRAHRRANTGYTLLAGLVLLSAAALAWYFFFGRGR